MFANVSCQRRIQDAAEKGQGTREETCLVFLGVALLAMEEVRELRAKSVAVHNGGVVYGTKVTRDSFAVAKWEGCSFIWNGNKFFFLSKYAFCRCYYPGEKFNFRREIV